MSLIIVIMSNGQCSKYSVNIQPKDCHAVTSRIHINNRVIWPLHVQHVNNVTPIF